MMRLGILLMLLALAGGAAAADQDGELKAAQGELKLAQEYLQAAGRNYGEQRNEALVHVKRALREIRLGLLGPRARARPRARAHPRRGLSITLDGACKLRYPRGE
jgi:hypothetical protein